MVDEAVAVGKKDTTDVFDDIEERQLWQQSRGLWLSYGERVLQANAGDDDEDAVHGKQSMVD